MDESSSYVTHLSSCYSLSVLPLPTVCINLNSCMLITFCILQVYWGILWGVACLQCRCVPSVVTDIPLNPATTSSFDNGFVVHWLNNKELQFTIESEKLMNDINSRAAAGEEHDDLDSVATEASQPGMQLARCWLTPPLEDAQLLVWGMDCILCFKLLCLNIVLWS